MLTPGELLIDINSDLSNKDFTFDPNLGTSLRDQIRDLADAFIRRLFYKLVYRTKYKFLPYKVDLILPERGMSLLERRKWLNSYSPLKNSRILVIGCGTASDFPFLLRFQPREIVGIDLLNYSKCWEQIKEYAVREKTSIKLDFYQADASTLNELGLGVFDIIISDAVFEHCRDLKSVLKNCYNLLQPKGVMYTSYGPFWYCWGGDHFSGRDDIEHGYNHLLLDSIEYAEYFNKYVGDLPYELSEGGGGLFVSLDLFSKLSHKEYIELFASVGFRTKNLIMEFSANAVKVLKSKELRGKLLKKFPDFTVDDFILKSHIVVLKKSH